MVWRKLLVSGIASVCWWQYCDSRSWRLTLASHPATQPLHFSWVDATQQPQFLAAFGLTPSDAPTVVVVSPRCCPPMPCSLLPLGFSWLQRWDTCLQAASNPTHGCPVGTPWSPGGLECGGSLCSVHDIAHLSTGPLKGRSTMPAGMGGLSRSRAGFRAPRGWTGC